MRNIYITLFILMAFGACQIEDENIDKTFTKVYGRQGESSISGITELSDGNLLLAGRQSRPAFLGSEASSIGLSGNLSERAMCLILTNQEGQILKERSYPISDIDIDPAFDFGDISGLSQLLKVYPLSNGGYIGLGEFRGFGISLGPPFNFELPPSPSNVSMFLAYFNANLELEKIDHFNGKTPWDGNFYSVGVLKPKPDHSGFVFMLGYNVSLNQRYLGFTLFQLDRDGEILSEHPYHSPLLRVARDFTFLESGNVLSIGQQGDFITLTEIDMNANQELNTYTINYKGVIGLINSNPMLIEKTVDNKIVAFYPDPTDSAYMHLLSSSYQTEYIKELEPDLSDQYPLTSSVCANGDILLVCIDLSNKIDENSIVYRLNPEGEMLFRARYSGRVRDIIESSDGGILLSNDVNYGGGIKKATLQKLSANGEL
jgi:hypothetical protein